MTPRLLPRSRPRKKSVDFSRLWWLLATEAAFQALSGPGMTFTDPERRRRWCALGARRLARVRETARAYLWLPPGKP